MPFAVSDPVFSTLYQAMNGLSARQDVTADNISNVDTPNYHASSVSFEDNLRSAVENGSVERSDVAITTSATDTPEGENGNNVDLRKETMTAMQTLYSYRLVSRAFSDHASLITDVTAQ